MTKPGGGKARGGGHFNVQIALDPLSCSFFFLFQLHLQHMEVPWVRDGIGATAATYTIPVAMPDP